MPPLTLNQAAKASGRSKATILQAVRAGKLTAPRDVHGNYAIEPAELFRVYPPKTTTDDKHLTDHQIPESFSIKIKSLEDALIKEREERDRERELLTNGLAREREQADHWRQQATGLLVYKPVSQNKFRQPLIWLIIGCVFGLLVTMFVMELWPTITKS